MKKLYLLLTVMACALAAQNVSADQYRYDRPVGNYAGGNYVGNACDTACPQEQACGDCYCLYCKYVPQYYTVQHCEKVPYQTYKKCCRYVPQYYNQCCCRYVPQYYYKTCCRYCPQYYYTCETKYCNKYSCETCCKYKPCYYYKHECANPCATTGCPR